MYSDNISPEVNGYVIERSRIKEQISEIIERFRQKTLINISINGLMHGLKYISQFSPQVQHNLNQD